MIKTKNKISSKVFIFLVVFGSIAHMRLASHTTRLSKARECLTSRRGQRRGEDSLSEGGAAKTNARVLDSHSQQTFGKRTGHFVEMEIYCLYLGPLKDWVR